jgi:hypothetical protein
MACGLAVLYQNRPFVENGKGHGAAHRLYGRDVQAHLNKCGAIDPENASLGDVLDVAGYLGDLEYVLPMYHVGCNPLSNALGNVSWFEMLHLSMRGKRATVSGRSMGM